MSVGFGTSPEVAAHLGEALELIAATAPERDQDPIARFPEREIAALERAGALAWNAQPKSVRRPEATELELVRQVARADGSVGRIFDGHLNAVERLLVQAPAQLRDHELTAIQAGALRAGVWGGDPRPGEGPPAAVVKVAGGEALRGVKTFCSGAGGLGSSARAGARPRWRSAAGGVDRSR